MIPVLPRIFLAIPPIAATVVAERQAVVPVDAAQPVVTPGSIRADRERPYKPNTRRPMGRHVSRASKGAGHSAAAQVQQAARSSQRWPDGNA